MNSREPLAILQEVFGYTAFRGQQQAIAGTALSTALPGYDRLIAAGYSCTEDVAGARADELITAAGLNRSEADAVIAAVGS